MRLRQVVLVAEDLAGAVAELTQELGAGAPFQDPGVKVFGLENAVLPIGDTFLEVVSPVVENAPAARYRARHGGDGGDGGYMLMLQSDDLARDRARVEAQGVRLAWEGALDDIAGIHLHPKDTGGPLLSLDQPRPPASWHWAGPGWSERSRSDVSRTITAAEVASPEPERLARRWGELLDQPVTAEGEGFAIALEPGRLRFVPGPAERLMGFDVEAADRARAGERLDLCGVTLRRV